MYVVYLYIPTGTMGGFSCKTR